MKVAFDIDGTLDIDPTAFQSLMSALVAAGHEVVVLTGCSSRHPSQGDLTAKQEYLTAMGMGHCWHELVVFGDPPHKPKAKWVEKHNVDILVDNSRKNAKLSSKFCTVLLPWNSKTD
jgi:uncharacterized HAD superfamily protein